MAGDAANDSEELRYLNVRDTAKRLGVHENTIRNWARAGILPTARVPGSRFHRFDERDVENLRKRRGATFAGVPPERRTIGPELVDASQLSQWATTAAREAQGAFPELVRRLLVATPGIANISIRAGDGVSAEGWDGRAESAGTSYLPAGQLCLEFGVGRSPKSKADEDYEKRVEDSSDADLSQLWFVFMTPRRWAGAQGWADARAREGVFAGVRVLDADDLEGWLRAAPVVHHWISEQLGRRPDAAETLEQWWTTFSSRTTPALPSGLFLAGREAERRKLLGFLGRPADVLAIKAPWRDDALAFLHAAMGFREEGSEDTPQEPPAALVITSPDAWARVTRQSGRIILVPLFDNPDVQLALEHEHHVVLCVGNEEFVRGLAVDLDPPARDLARQALEAAGVSFDRAYRLSALARRSMPALVRELSKDPQVVRPGWAQPRAARLLAPLLLVGSWTTSPQDTDLVSRIVDEPWSTIEGELRYWHRTDDPPFVRSADQWHLASPEEAFLVLHQQLGGTDLARWRDLALKVLFQLDPVLDLSETERLVVGFRNSGEHYSGVVRRGIASGIALLGSAGTAEVGETTAATDYSTGVVREVLARANEDPTGRLWRSLSDVLPLLAEGAPDAFLDAVEEDLARDVPLLVSMFQDNESSSMLYTSSPHSGLLWALETLCWSPDYLIRSCLALARLEVIDPGGRLANRPLESLRTVLVGWIRHTSATRDVKECAVAQVCRRVSDVGWKLLLRLLPSYHAVTSPTVTPRYNDWTPDNRDVTVPEFVAYIGTLVTQALELAGEDTERWATLTEHAAQLPPDDRERVLSALEQFASQPLTTDDQLLLWERLHKEVSRHRQFPDAEWAMKEPDIGRLAGLVERIAPTTTVERFAYLFDWRPDLPEVDRSNYQAYQDRMWELRNAAVRETLDHGSVEALRRLVDRVTVPRLVGASLGVVADGALESNLLVWLDAENPRYVEAAMVWAVGRLTRSDGADWLSSALRRPELETGTRRVRLAVCVPATRRFWDLLGELDPGLLDAYWRDVALMRVAATDIAKAASELVSHERPWEAIDLAAGVVAYPDDRDREAVSTELVRTMLDAALQKQTPAPNLGYEVGVLLDRLLAGGTDLTVVAAYEFAFFRLTQHHRVPRAVFQLLRDDPEQFVILVSRVYRGKNERERLASEEDALRAHHTYSVLSDWHELPGIRDDGTIDAEHLRNWVYQARLAFADADRADIGDQQIGQVLSASPPGTDGVRPAEPVRELIETIGSTDIEAGYHTGVIKERGFTSRGVFDGGQQERKLAAQYRAWSEQTAGAWLRTSRLLRKLAEHYEWLAREEDARADISADTE